MWTPSGQYLYRIGSKWDEIKELDFLERRRQMQIEEDEYENSFIGSRCPKCQKNKLAVYFAHSQCVSCGYEEY